MTKVEAIIHLYKRGTISENKAYVLAETKKLSKNEIDELKKQIDIFNNPPNIEEDD